MVAWPISEGVDCCYSYSYLKNNPKVHCFRKWDSIKGGGGGGGGTVRLQTYIALSQDTASLKCSDKPVNIQLKHSCECLLLGLKG